MHPTPLIAISAIFSAICAQPCATETPIGDIAERGTGEMERARVKERLHANVEFGATDSDTTVVWCSSDLGVARSELDLLYSVMGCI